MADDTQQKIHDFFSKFPARSYPKGQILIFADESPEHVFYIKNGKIRQYAITYRGDEVIVNIFKPPAFFPMSWAINHTDNEYFYKTEEPTELHVVPANEAIAFIKENPDVMFDLLSRVYRGLDGLLGRMVHLMSGSAKSRLMYELLVECRRFGKQQAQGSYLLRTNESDLAARSGLSRETVSREMQKLKESGWVVLTNKGIEIADVAQLEKSLGEEI
jgi:CRP/FNR family transcriptional regulator